MDNKYKSQVEHIISTYEDDDYYKSYFEKNILAKHIQDNKSRGQIQLVTIPFLKFITDSISLLYSKSVVRTINYSENKEINDIFNIVNESFDDVAEQIDKYTFIGGMSALKPTYDSDNNEFEYMLYPSNFLSYEPDSENYLKAKTLNIEYDLDDVKILETYNNKELSKIVDDIEVMKEENPILINPLTIFRNKKIVNNFYIAPQSALLDVQNFITNQIVQMGNNYKYQSMSMLVLKGGADIKQLNFGANAINKIGNDDSLDFITPSSSLSELVNIINETIKLFNRINGIPDSLLTASATSSGVSLTISQKALDDYVGSRSKIFKKSEKEAIIKGMKLLAYYKGVKIPDDLDININYLAVSNLTKLTQDEINLYNFYLSKNIMSIVDLTKMLTNAKYDSDVLEMLEKNKKINNDFNSEEIIKNIQEKEIEETI